MSAVNPLYPRSVVVLAAASLGIYSALSLLALAAYLSVAFEPWTWKSLLVLVCAIAAAVDGALLVRKPAQAHVAMGLTVMGLSTLRVGDPYVWNWASFAILIGTLVLSLPVLRALFMMREIDRMTE